VNVMAPAVKCDAIYCLSTVRSYFSIPNHRQSGYTDERRAVFDLYVTQHRRRQQTERSEPVHKSDIQISSPLHLTSGRTAEGKATAGDIYWLSIATSETKRLANIESSAYSPSSYYHAALSTIRRNKNMKRRFSY
jgi:hypothetical protein